jgi:hypothetical protein
LNNNNNIAWKNVTVVDVNASNSIEPGGIVAVGNPVEQPAMYYLELEVAELETGNPIFVEAEVHLEMDEILHNAWVRGGEIAQDLEETENEEELIVKGDNVILDNIAFDPNEIGKLHLTFNFLTEELTDKPTFVYHVIQREWHTRNIVGDETFIINKELRPNFSAEANDQWAYLQDEVILQASDIGEEAIYRWYGDEDELLHTGISFIISEADEETYTLEVTAAADGYKDYTEVSVFLLPSEILNISPNPSNSLVTIDYKLDNCSTAELIISDLYMGNSSYSSYPLDISKNQKTIDLTSFKAGYYTVGLKVDGQVVDAKTVIKN